MYESSRAQVAAHCEIDYYLRLPHEGFPLLIFLHGFGETFGHLWRHFKNYIPDQYGILAPNGPFPLPQKNFNSPEWKLRFCWYFYDSAKKEYFIDQRFPAEVLTNLINDLSLGEIEKKIIGFSQGGYLAPFLGKNLKNVNTCISINSEYKHLMLPEKLPFVISNICGEDDEIVDPKNCQNSHKMMIKQGNTGEFILLSETGHQINNKIVKTVLDTLDISAN